ncbi:hypothetical protein HI914_02232 [Erysiphe necator]|nr:hypothetical protein HI914_02232 [Erysiphe necator]
MGTGIVFKYPASIYPPQVCSPLIVTFRVPTPDYNAMDIDFLNLTHAKTYFHARSVFDNSKAPGSKNADSDSIAPSHISNALFGKVRC